MNCSQDFYLLPIPGTPSVNTSAVVSIMTVFRSIYLPIHPFLLVSTSLFSFFSNILILIVLSRKEMRRSGINVTMMFIAFTDFGYSGFALLKTMMDRMVIKFWNSPRCSLIMSSLVLVVSFSSTFFIPFMLLISPTGIDEFVLKTNPVFLEDNCFLIRATQLLNAFWFKGFSCISMSILSIILLKKVEEGVKSQKLANSNSAETSEMMSRSSRLIFRILIVFLLTEFPQAFITLFGGLFYIDYIRYILPTFGELTYMLALINSSVAFVFYSIMSSKFRRIFCQVFVPGELRNWLLKGENKIIPVASQSDSLQHKHFIVASSG